VSPRSEHEEEQSCATLLCSDQTPMRAASAGSDDGPIGGDDRKAHAGRRAVCPAVSIEPQISKELRVERGESVRAEERPERPLNARKAPQSGAFRAVNGGAVTIVTGG
jgi:hypothetical protein